MGRFIVDFLPWQMKEWNFIRWQNIKPMSETNHTSWSGPWILFLVQRNLYCCNGLSRTVVDKLSHIWHHRFSLPGTTSTRISTAVSIRALLTDKQIFSYHCSAKHGLCTWRIARRGLWKDRCALDGTQGFARQALSLGFVLSLGVTFPFVFFNVPATMTFQFLRLHSYISNYFIICFLLPELSLISFYK